MSKLAMVAAFLAVVGPMVQANRRAAGVVGAVLTLAGVVGTVLPGGVDAAADVLGVAGAVLVLAAELMLAA